MDNEFEYQNPENGRPQPEEVLEPVQEQEPVQEPIEEIPAEETPVEEMPRFEPSASEYRWVRPSQPQEPVMQPAPEKKKKEKKGMTGGKVIALALCCALIGGIVGGIGSALLLKDDNKTEELPENTNISNVLEGLRESTVIEVHQIDTSKQMTTAEVYAANVNSTVGITTLVTTNYWGYQSTSPASGSGFIYSDDGYILTNYHVVEGSNSITVSMYDGTTLDAQLVGYDENNDIAVLKVEAENLVPVVVGDSDNVNVGDPVVAIGNPLGELTFSLTAGAVSALDRQVTFSDGLVMDLIQTDCAINSGNSGGALFNLYGEVIGITNAKYSGNSSSGATIDNIGFAIPVNRVRSIVNSIIEKGYVVKPYIGVSIVDVSEETQSYGLPQGAAIRSVDEGSPAQSCGLQTNDIITHVNGESITSSSELKKYVTDSTPGDVLRLTLWRQGQTLEVDLTVGEKIQTAVEEENQQQEQQQSIPNFSWGGW